ncbi:MAG: hypothetical protein RSG07_02725, partial [Erysipelotrichaceae bacterium]
MIVSILILCGCSNGEPTIKLGTYFLDGDKTKAGIEVIDKEHIKYINMDCDSFSIEFAPTSKDNDSKTLEAIENTKASIKSGCLSTNVYNLEKVNDSDSINVNVNIGTSNIGITF